MCGIAGIFSYHESADLFDRKELKKMCDYMRSRGPDGEGEWFSVNNRIGLGHRRLSIIDLSENASQPMESQDGNVVIIFNGEIYNYKELRHRLENKGCVFTSSSDTEVILQLYIEKGADMLMDLRGMFALAIWDSEKKAVLLARDHFGIKPLYYSDDGRTFRFASQTKAILSGQQVSRVTDSAGLVGFYLFGNVPEPFTYYKHIHALPAGSYLWVTESSGPKKINQYFSVADQWVTANETLSINNYSNQEIREALLDSVNHHMIADVPVGAFLSGGVDSSALVGLMVELTGSAQQLRTITLAFDEFRGKHSDESQLAEQVAKYYGTEHSIRNVSEKEFYEDLPNIFHAMDQPTIDGINTWFVSKATKEKGLKVAVSGLGGDELFGGYPSFKDIHRLVKLLHYPSKFSCFQKLIHNVIGSYSRKRSGVNPKLVEMAKYGGTYSGAYLLKRGLFMPEELPSLIEEDVLGDGLRRLDCINYISNFIRPEPPTSYSKISTLETSIYMRNQLLRDADWASMAHSLEVRVPLVDVVLFKKLAPIFIREKKLNGKSLLGTSPSKHIPGAILKRKKTGFKTPINSWLERAHFSRLKLSGIETNFSPWSRRWAVLVNQHFVNL